MFMLVGMQCLTIVYALFNNFLFEGLKKKNLHFCNAEVKLYLQCYFYHALISIVYFKEALKRGLSVLNQSTST